MLRVEFAERLRHSVEAHPFQSDRGPLNVTVSIGVSEIGDDPGWDQALTRADEALYEAKSKGRNRVCLRTEDP